MFELCKWTLGGKHFAYFPRESVDRGREECIPSWDDICRDMEMSMAQTDDKKSTGKKQCLFSNI